VKDNLRWRQYLLDLAAKSEADRAALARACSEDCHFWINSFAWQYNPRAEAGSDEVGPFVTWDVQDEAIHTILDCVERGRDLVIEKSRYMGASWMCLLVCDWLFLYKRNAKFNVISRNEKAVESDNSDSLFWKIDFVHKNLPEWLLPKGRADSIKRVKLFFGNPHLNTSIVGEASTGKAGVGGRCKAMFIDEFSQIAEAEEVLGRTADTTRCRIFNFTHVGVGTTAFRLAQRPDVKKLVLHWSSHPERGRGAYRFDVQGNRVELLDSTAFDAEVRHPDGSAETVRFPEEYPFQRVDLPSGGPFPGVRSPWYDSEVVRRDDARQVAMDLDIDAKGSATQFYDQLRIGALVREYAREPDWEGDVYYDRDAARPLQLVPMKGGPLRLWVNPGDEMRVPTGPYAAGADIAAGTGRTPSCLSVVHAGTGEKVAEYASAHVPPEEFALLAVSLCKVFTHEDELTGERVGAYLTWEHAGPGFAFAKAVLEVGYRRIYYRVDEFDLTSVRSDSPGWVPQPRSIRLLHDQYRAALYGRKFLNRSQRALEETLDYQYVNGIPKHGGEASEHDPSGAKENHGDRVVADALANKGVLELGLGGVGAAKKGPGDPPPDSLAGRRKLWQDRRREQVLFE
jgi:hypothetical protein